MIFNKKLNLKNGIFKYPIKHKITNKISDFYQKNPFPNYLNNESINDIKKKGDHNIITRDLKKFIGYNKTVLEAGAGTSQLSNYLAIGTNNEIYALDPTEESLKLGLNFATKNKLKNIKFINADIFDNIFKDNSFDLVWCSGVLHHTKDPYGGFAILANQLKINGYIVIGLYNYYGRFRTFVRQFLFKYFSKKLTMILDPVIRNIGKKESLKLNAWIQDQYEHPVESSHSYDEILDWFKKNNIEFINAYPSHILDPRNNNFFKKINNNSKFDRLIQQICILFTKQGSEGGLFLFLGKKIK